MKRLILIALFLVAAWFAWKHGAELFEKRPQHDVEVTNGGSAQILRLRVTVAGQTFVKDVLEPGATATWHFRTNDDTEFQLIWQFIGQAGEASWSGGRIARGPIVQRHRLTIQADNGVVYMAEDKPEPGAGK